MTVARTFTLPYAQPLTVSAQLSIPGVFSWVVCDRTHDSNSVADMEGIVACYMEQISRSAGAANVDIDVSTVRTWALVLGAIRSSMADSFRVACSDLSQEDVVHAGPALGALAACGRHLVDTLEQSRTRVEFSSIEQSVVNAVAFAGPALPVLQGTSLSLSGAEFSPDTRGMFVMLKRRVMNTLTEPAQAWIEELSVDFDRLAFEIACHPLHDQVKRELTRSTVSNYPLALAGFGA